MERDDKIGELAKALNEAEAKAQEWLAVFVRCLHLQDALSVLKLDRGCWTWLPTSWLDVASRRAA